MCALHHQLAELNPAFAKKSAAAGSAAPASAANATSLPPPPGGSWCATAKHIRVEANATGYFLKAKLETQQTGIVPAFLPLAKFLAPGAGRRWRDAETHFKQRDAFENRDGHFVRESKVQAASEEETLRWREEWNVLGPLETLAFAASGRARVSKCWGLWQGARLKTRLLASRKELAETKSELKLARVNLAKAERLQTVHGSHGCQSTRSGAGGTTHATRTSEMWESSYTHTDPGLEPIPALTRTKNNTISLPSEVFSLLACLP